MTTILSPKAPLSKAEQDCVDLLQEALDFGKDGKIKAVGIILCTEDGIATVMAGPNAGGLNLGLDRMKDEIKAAIFDDGNLGRPAGKPNIIRVRR